MTDKEHLEWIYARMVTIHREHTNVDYMIKFKEILDRYPVKHGNIQIMNDELQSSMFGSAFETQEGGDHYKKLGLYQPWMVLAKWMTAEELKGAMKKDVIAYLAREADKGGREDIKKALHTIQIYLELTNDQDEHS